MSPDNEIIMQLHSLPGFESEHAGKFLRDFNPKPAPHGILMTTEDVELAKGFDSLEAAMKFYRQQHGMRPDGRPNRPITAFSVEFSSRGRFKGGKR